MGRIESRTVPVIAHEWRRYDEIYVQAPRVTATVWHVEREPDDDGNNRRPHKKEDLLEADLSIEFHTAGFRPDVSYKPNIIFALYSGRLVGGKFERLGHVLELMGELHMNCDKVQRFQVTARSHAQAANYFGTLDALEWAWIKDKDKITWVPC